MTEVINFPNQKPGTKSVGVDLAGAIHPNSLVDGDGQFPGCDLLVVWREDLCSAVVKVLLERAILHFSDSMF